MDELTRKLSLRNPDDTDRLVSIRALGAEIDNIRSAVTLLH